MNTSLSGCIKNLDDYQSLLYSVQNVRASLQFQHLNLNSNVSKLDQAPENSLALSIKVFLYIVVILIALVANFLIILVIVLDNSLKKPTNIFMFNLALCDLSILFSCIWVQIPLNLNDYWVLGELFCKVNSYMQMVSIISSVLTLVMIACDRFIGIMYPFTSRLIGNNMFI